MNQTITLKGIDQAIEGLNYRNKNALKYKLIYAIREFYHDDSSVETLKGIDPEKLIDLLWNTKNNPGAVNHKRKNLNSLKSSINTDLKKIYEEDKNPEGIVIGANNIFSMSEEAKDNTLKTFANKVMIEGEANLDDVAKALSAIDKVLSDSGTNSADSAKDKLKQLDKLIETIRGMSEKYGGFGHTDTESKGAGGDEKSNNRISEPNGSDIPASGLESEDKGGSEDKASGKEDIPGISTKGNLDKTGSGSEDGTKEGSGDEPGDKTDSKADGEYGSAADALGTDAFEEIDVIDEDSEDLEIIEEIESDDIEEEDELGVGNGDASESYAEGDVSATDTLETLDAINEETEDLEIIDEIEPDVLDEIDEAIDENFDEVINATTENMPDQLTEASGSEAEGAGSDKKDNRGISETGGSDLPASGLESGDKGGSEDKESGKEDIPGISTKGDFDKTGSGSEDGTKEGSGDESGNKTDFKTDGEYGSAADALGTDAFEEIDFIDDDNDDLEIIEEIESDDIEEETELGVGKGDGAELNTESNALATGALEATDGLNEDSEEDARLGGEGGDSTGNNSNAKIFEDDFDITEARPADINKAKVLAEEFNHSLAAMDKYYNQYILIPEGTYIIGSKHPKKGEHPENAVDLPAFYIGKYPVTNALFEVFVEKTGYKTTAEKRGYGKVYFGRYEKTVDEKTGMEKLIFNAATKQKTVEGACWYQPCGPGSMIHKKRNHPVVQISLEDAMAFASWTGKRLPTEDEWEAASRTTRGNILPWGNKFKKEACNIEESSVCGTTSVDNYQDFENHFGIVDMLGNVFEWTLTRIDKFMIGKGGCWLSGVDIRLFSRFQLEPDGHSNILGFRCVAY